MARRVNEIETIPLSSAEKGKIEVAVIEEPYGVGSEAVASIGIFLDGSNEEPDWKVHIPKDDIDGVIEALKRAKEAI